MDNHGLKDISVEVNSGELFVILGPSGSGKTTLLRVIAGLEKATSGDIYIEKLLKRKPFELSGGQRQKVALGRAIIRNPKVFLFDEPLRNFDTRFRISLIETYYAIKINDDIIITPNIQLVMNPGGLKSESPATVFGIRCRIKF